MKTLLDEFRTTYLRAVVYTGDGELRVIIAEGFQAAEPEDLWVAGHVIKDTYALSTSEDSRLVEVRFNKPIAWQVVDESFTVWDETEECDDESKLKVLTRSKYLNFIRTSHGWFEDTRGLGKHYRLWTEDDVVDVIACEPPEVDFTGG